MALGPNNPVWQKLYDQLALLAADCKGRCAFVVDEGNGLWCVGVAGESSTFNTRIEDKHADRFYRNVIVPRESDLRKGKHIEVVETEGDDRYAAISFAGIYMLVVWFDAAFDTSMTRAKMRRALPMIESLVLQLPPSGGPGAGEAEGAQRA